MNSILMTNTLIIVGVIAIVFGMGFIVACLARINSNIVILVQMVSIAIQRSGLVRTPEEVEEDTEEAMKTMEEEMEQEEVPRHEIPADADEEDLTF